MKSCLKNLRSLIFLLATMKGVAYGCALEEDSHSSSPQHKIISFSNDLHEWITASRTKKENFTEVKFFSVNNHSLTLKLTKKDNNLSLDFKCDSHNKYTPITLFHTPLGVEHDPQITLNLTLYHLSNHIEG